MIGTNCLDNVSDSSAAQRTLPAHSTVREDAWRVRICFSGQVDISSADLVDAAVADALRSADAGCQARYLIRDRDGKFPELFDAVLADTGIEVVLTGIQMPHERDHGAVDSRAAATSCSTGR